jgi:hypothetical protein
MMKGTQPALGATARAPFLRASWDAGLCSIAPSRSPIRTRGETGAADVVLRVVVNRYGVLRLDGSGHTSRVAGRSGEGVNSQASQARQCTRVAVPVQ